MNQFTEQFSILELAELVQKVTGCEISNIPNPRVEQEDHYYNAKHTALLSLGLEPHLLTEGRIGEMFGVVKKHKKQINIEAMMPKIMWRQ